MHTYFKRLYILSILAVLLGLLVTVIPGATAASSSSTTITQSYTAGPSVLSSMLVRLNPKAQTTVIPLTNNDTSDMSGVVVPANNTAITLTPENSSTQQVFVSPSGRYDVLVSNQNGSVAAGDYLSMSALPGIAMKASTSQALIIGRAVGNFNGTNAISSVGLKNAQNTTDHVAVGLILASVQLAPNPLYLKSSNSVLVFLTRAEYNVTNKPVSSLRTYLVSLILLASILITVVILYTGIRSEMIAIGRNPLAKSAINRGLLKIIVTGLLVFASGILIVYLILNH